MLFEILLECDIDGGMGFLVAIKLLNHDPSAHIPQLGLATDTVEALAARQHVPGAGRGECERLSGA